MSIINDINDILNAVLDQDIKQSREQINQYFYYQKVNIQNNPYLTDCQKTAYLDALEFEKQRLLNIQDKRELTKNLAKFFNVASKYCEKEEKKQ